MKSHFALLLLFTFILPSHAKERYSGYFMDWEFQENTKVHENYKTLGIKTLSTALTDKKGRTTRMIQTFDKDGRLESTIKFNHKGEQVSVFKQTFNTFGKLIRTELTTDKKYKTSRFEYNENQKLIYHEIQSNGKLAFYRTWKYNDQGLLVEHSSFNEKGLLSKVQHHFDDNNKRVKTEYFNRKNKLTHAYNYKCSDEGEQVALAEKEKLVCAFDAREDGLLIRIEETTDAKGRISRVVSKYCEADTILIERNYFDNQGKLNFRAKYYPFNELLKSRESFNRSGELLFSTKYDYDSNWHIIQQQTERKGKTSHSIRWVYDDHGICQLQEHQDAKNKLLHRRAIEVLDYH